MQSLAFQGWWREAALCVVSYRMKEYTWGLRVFSSTSHEQIKLCTGVCTELIQSGLKGCPQRSFSLFPFLWSHVNTGEPFKDETVLRTCSLMAWKRGDTVPCLLRDTLYIVDTHSGLESVKSWGTHQHSNLSMDTSRPESPAPT